MYSSSNFLSVFYFWLLSNVTQTKIINFFFLFFIVFELSQNDRTHSCYTFDKSNIEEKKEVNSTFVTISLCDDKYVISLNRIRSTICFKKMSKRLVFGLSNLCYLCILFYCIPIGYSSLYVERIFSFVVIHICHSIEQKQNQILECTKAHKSIILFSRCKRSIEIIRKW